MDSVLYSAVHQKVPVIIALTCCADRYPGMSHAIIAPHMPFAEYKALARRSQNRRSRDGMEAVAQIDDLRENYLKAHGYNVYRGWQTDAQGVPLPSGSWMVGVRKKGNYYG